MNLKSLRMINHNVISRNADCASHDHVRHSAKELTVTHGENTPERDGRNELETHQQPSSNSHCTLRVCT